MGAITIELKKWPDEKPTTEGRKLWVYARSLKTVKGLPVYHQNMRGAMYTDNGDWVGDDGHGLIAPDFWADIPDLSYLANAPEP